VIESTIVKYADKKLLLKETIVSESTIVKYADKKLLQLINKISTSLGYNRVLNKEFLDNLDSNENYYVAYHIAYEVTVWDNLSPAPVQPSEPHIRCVFNGLDTVPTGGAGAAGAADPRSLAVVYGGFILDMPNYCFELLPKQEIRHGLK